MLKSFFNESIIKQKIYVLLKFLDETHLSLKNNNFKIRYYIDSCPIFFHKIKYDNKNIFQLSIYIRMNNKYPIHVILFYECIFNESTKNDNYDIFYECIFNKDIKIDGDSLNKIIILEEPLYIIIVSHVNSNDDVTLFLNYLKSNCTIPIYFQIFEPLKIETLIHEYYAIKSNDKIYNVLNDIYSCNMTHLCTFNNYFPKNNRNVIVK